MFGGEVDVGTLVVEEGGDFVVAVVGGYVQGGEAAFGCYVGVVVVLREIRSTDLKYERSFKKLPF